MTKNASAAVLALTMLLVLVAGALAGSGLVEGHLMIMAVGFLGIAYFLGRRGARDGDRKWLPRILVLGMAAKLTGSWIRHYVLMVTYEGVGDARGYHNSGLELAEQWRSLAVPALETIRGGSEGTRFVHWITGLLYAPYEPSSLGGFWIYALVAFVGQVLLYFAFRNAFEASKWKRYAYFIFFWPTMLYWPSSIGKESLIVLFLGMGAWGASRLFQEYQYRWVPLIVLGVWLTSQIRVHVAALLAASAIAGALLAVRPGGAKIAFRRLTVLVAGFVAIFPLALSVGEEFNVNLSESVSVDDLDPVFSEVERRTEQGGSAVSVGAIRSPADIPAGVLKVLFRPLPNEASNLQTLGASAEGALLLLLVAWRAPKTLSNLRWIRSSPYLMLCIAYTSMFIWAWSSINNLGIIARQRSLLVPFFLALIAGLGWNGHAETTEEITPNQESAVGSEVVPPTARSSQSE